MLEAKQLTKTFDNVTALDRLDLRVEAGEIICLLGANGAGKTTTINLFLGFLEPTAGNAFVNGLNVRNAALETKKYLAYIPEQVALYPQLSGIENLNYFLRLAGIRKSRSDLIAVLIEAGLDETSATRRASSYSKGMRQKIGIAIALAKNAKALLLDEPLSGLDPSAANTLCKSLLQLRDDGHAILMATHDVFRAKEIGTRIGIMKAGKLVDDLDASLLDAREIEQIYLAHMHDSNVTDIRSGAAA
ncbi:ABC transporter ATP-binding protein [Hyphococcus lacteus]|uniref:ABC transporter ATP-binding protein n=1 Tax=Hyphococcus lacteus TaxID=3143536 RepID=A0ABV3Z645_9PROT